MTGQRLFFALFIWAVLPAALLSASYQTDDSSSTSTETVVLYDGRLGTTPDQQGFSFLVFGTTPSQQYANGLTVLDTTAASDDQAGYFNREAQKLNRGSGYRVQIALRIEEEEHLSQHRAGFSMIILSDDLLGLEIGFWEDEIWVQEGGTGTNLFTHAEGVSFDTTAALIIYELSVLDEAYTLTADGVPLLNGSLRDYTAFEGFPDVYETPGLLFMGDNTSRGAVKAAVSYVALELQSVATPMASATVTILPGITPPPQVTPSLPPTATATPEAADKLYVWLPCLKGVDENIQK